MEKRVVIAIGLAVLVMLGWSYLFPAPKPVAPSKTGQPAAPVAPAATATTAPGQAAAPAAQPETSPARKVSVVAESLPARDIAIDTSLYKMVISTRGGVIKSFRLVKYKDASGQPLEMVRHPEGMRPLVAVPEGKSWQEAQDYPYTADASEVALSSEKPEGSLTLNYNGPDGVSIVKRLKFKEGSYAFDAELDVKGIPSCTVYMGDGFGSLAEKAGRTSGFVGPYAYVDGQSHKENPEKIKETLTYQGKGGWAGVMDKYFMAVLAPEGGIKAVLGKGASEWGYAGVVVPGGAGRFMVYAGPKEYDRLKALDRDLSRAVDFGWFTFIAKPLFVSLKFFDGMVKNWGWSIIIITVIIKLAFAPLTHKSQKSMKKMQKLQPLFAELKEKHKGDAQRLNREMMELYKKHKVNPMGGCLPMLIQIPVFIALYNVLNNAIELRQAPFMWWLHDLSAKDPYYILPILMGASMFVMQKMTPTSMDPKQNQIMMIMPVVLTFMFISLPSGLVLYFTVSNLLSMAQQFYINKYSKE